MQTAKETAKLAGERNMDSEELEETKPPETPPAIKEDKPKPTAQPVNKSSAKSAKKTASTVTTPTPTAQSKNDSEFTWPDLSVTGLLVSNQKGSGSAVVNNTVIKVGQQISGVTLISVSSEGATFQSGKLTKLYTTVSP